jgi:hypothetical protein
MAVKEVSKRTGAGLRSEGVEEREREEVIDAITCGCFSPHGLGYQNKMGLNSMENELDAARCRIEILKRTVKVDLDKTIERGEIVNHSSSTFVFHERLGKESLDYETAVLLASRRKG